MIHGIIVPLDGTSQAQEALPLAAHIARLTHSTLTLLQGTHAPVLSGGRLDPPMLFLERAEAHRQHVMADLAAIANDPVLRDIIVQCETIEGPVAQGIAEVAQRTDAGMIVMRSHGRTGLAHFVLGSIAEETARMTHLPTLLVRDALNSLLTTQPLVMLLSLDGSSFAEQMLDPAIAFAQALQCTVRVVRVLPTPNQESAAQVHEAEQYLAQIQQRLTQQGVSCTTTLGWGDPVVCICDKAQEHGQEAQIIAMTTHGQRTLDHAFDASVALQVWHHIPLPMLLLDPIDDQQSSPWSGIGLPDREGL